MPIDLPAELVHVPKDWILPPLTGEAKGSLREEWRGPYAPGTVRVWKEQVTAGLDRFGGYWAAEPFVWVVSNGGTFYHWSVTQTAIEAILEAGLAVSAYKEPIQEWLKSNYKTLRAALESVNLTEDQEVLLLRLQRLEW